MPMVILAGLVGGPVVLLFLLRVNAALVFLSLCLGDVLVQFVGRDAVTIVSGASVGVHTTASLIRLVLLLAPAALTTVLMIRTVSGHGRILNILPAAGTGLLLALLVVPQLSAGLAASILRSSAWQNMLSFQSGTVALSAVICLFFLWLQRPKRGSKKEGKHKE